MPTREAKILLVIGGRGSGKTYFLEHRCRKDDTIVIEYFKTERWKGYKKYFFNDLQSGKVSIKELGNSTIVFEDATAYISSNMANYMKRLIVNSKQVGSDVIIVFHSLNIVPPFLWYLINNIVLFNCAKPKENAQNTDYYNEIMQKWNKLQHSKPYSYEEIQTQI